MAKKPKLYRDAINLNAKTVANIPQKLLKYLSTATLEEGRQALKRHRTSGGTWFPSAKGKKSKKAPTLNQGEEAFTKEYGGAGVRSRGKKPRRRR